MEKINDTLRIKIALDTQILAYLIDNTYPSLNIFIKTLSENPFVDLACSKFAIYEFIGIRKLEHYLRCLVTETQSKGGNVNFSSAIKYKSEFDSPELKYIDAYKNVKEEVEKELKSIYDNFGIIYENINIHNELWKPHQDLVLSTKISKEDSLLLLSTIYPDSLFKEDFLILFTNDSQFYNSFNDIKWEEVQNEIFENHSLIKPQIHNLRKCELLDKTTVNFTETIDIEKINSFANNFIFEQIQRKNSKLLLGKTISCACNANLKKQFLCFQLEDEKELVANLYLTILTKSFILYNHPLKLSDFYSHGKIDLPYKANEDIISKEISIKLADEEGKNIDEEIMNNIISTGNLVFIHPDSFI